MSSKYNTQVDNSRNIGTVHQRETKLVVLEVSIESPFVDAQDLADTEIIVKINGRPCRRYSGYAAQRMGIVKSSEY